MSIKSRKALDKINDYVPAKSIESVKREFGIEKVIKLAGNENPLGYSNLVKDKIQNSFKDYSYYPDMNSTVLREELAKYHNISTEEFIFGNGSFELITLIAQTFLEEGEEAITIEPSFGWYKNVTLQMGANITLVPLRNFHVDLEDILSQITEKTKVIWLCNPNNPVGTIVNSNQLEKFLESLREDIILVLDEAYVDFVTENDFPDSISITQRYHNVIVLRTFSKVYGLASFRIGYGIASSDIRNAMNKVRIPINTNALAQTAAVESLKDVEFKELVLDNNRRSLELYYIVLEELGLRFIPSNCNFILFDTGLDSVWVAEEYLKRGIIVRAGTEFGLSTWLRVSIGKYEENILVLNILKKLLGGLSHEKRHL